MRRKINTRKRASEQNTQRERKKEKEKKNLDKTEDK